MLRRSREKAKPDNMNQYYAVIAFFCASMVAALLYTLMNPTQSFSSMPVVDESAMLVHNGQNHRFTQAPNEFFRVSASAAKASERSEMSLFDLHQLCATLEGMDDFGREKTL
jgi:hypothetical protein